MPNPGGENNYKTIAIRVISNIIQKYKTAASNLKQDPQSVIRQIVDFWGYIPDELKGAAFKVLKYLWGEKITSFSTEKQKADNLTNIKIGNERLLNLRDILQYKDKSIISQSVEVANLHNRYLHLESEERKREIDNRYHSRGITICNMITTGDIEEVLNDLQAITKKEDKLCRFEWWIKHYTEISILISPDDLGAPKEIEDKIIDIATKLTQPFLLFHLTGNEDECKELLNLIINLKKKQLLNYTNKPSNIIKDSGFCKAINIRIDFPDL